MKPVLCNYYLTYRCNARCGFCDIWEQPSPLVSLDDVRTNLDDLKRLGVRVVDFTGGEPLLHPQLDEILAMAKERGFLTTVTTNGLLYPKRARQLAGKVDMLHFSIDSPVREEHNESRGVQCFDSVMQSIEVARSLGEYPDLLFTVTNSNWHRMRELYETISYPNRLILILNPLFQYHDLGANLGDEAMREMKRIARKPYTYLNPAFLTLHRRGGNDINNPACKAVSSTVVISPFNEIVLPCYHFGLEKVPIGGRLYELWHSDVVAQQRAMEGRHPGCQGCTVNCYFEPSFATSPETLYFWQALPSKVQYSWTKFVVQRARSLSRRRNGGLPEPYEAIVPSREG